MSNERSSKQKLINAIDSLGNSYVDKVYKTILSHLMPKIIQLINEHWQDTTAEQLKEVCTDHKYIGNDIDWKAMADELNGGSDE